MRGITVFLFWWAFCCAPQWASTCPAGEHLLSNPWNSVMFSKAWYKRRRRYEFSFYFDIITGDWWISMKWRRKWLQKFPSRIEQCSYTEKNRRTKHRKGFFPRPPTMPVLCLQHLEGMRKSLRPYWVHIQKEIISDLNLSLKRDKACNWMIVRD